MFYVRDATVFLFSVLCCMLYCRPMIQEKMNVLEQVGLSESNISEKAESASFHSKVSLHFHCLKIIFNQMIETLDFIAYCIFISYRRRDA